jgi:hypothetical protein
LLAGLLAVVLVAGVSERAGPTDAGYPLKRGLEGLRVGLAPGDAARCQVLLDLGRRRLEETRRLVEAPAGEPAVFRAVLEDLGAAYSGAIALARRSADSGVELRAVAEANVAAAELERLEQVAEPIEAVALVEARDRLQAELVAWGPVRLSPTSPAPVAATPTETGLPPAASPTLTAAPPVTAEPATVAPTATPKPAQPTSPPPRSVSPTRPVVPTRPTWTPSPSATAPPEPTDRKPPDAIAATRTPDDPPAPTDPPRDPTATPIPPDAWPTAPADPPATRQSEPTLPPERSPEPPPGRPTDESHGQAPAHDRR